MFRFKQFINVFFLVVVVLMLFGCTFDKEKLKQVKSLAIVNISVQREQNLSDIFGSLNIPLVSDFVKDMDRTSNQEVETYLMIDSLFRGFFKKNFVLYEFDQARLAKDEFIYSFVKEAKKEHFVIPSYKYITLADSVDNSSIAVALCDYFKTDAVMTMLLSFQETDMSARIIMINSKGEIVINNSFTLQKSQQSWQKDTLVYTLKDLENLFGNSNIMDVLTLENYMASVKGLEFESYIRHTMIFLKELDEQFNGNKQQEYTRIVNW